MRARIERRARSALKRVDDPATGERVAAWSHHLSQRGVNTPPATYDARSDVLRFPWISGTPGGDLLARSLAADAGTGGRVRTPEVLRRMFDPLIRLHGIAPADLDLDAIDPWRRVRPRLAAFAAAPARSAAFEIANRAHATVIDLQATPPPRGPDLPVHGDLHVGQLIMDGDGRAWLLDLDDLCAGPPEADLGNFVAHLCTREPFTGPHIVDDLGHYRRLVVMAYVDAGGTDPDPRRLHWYAAAGLIRRSLKLLERDLDHSRAESGLTGANHCLQVSRAT